MKSEEGGSRWQELAAARSPSSTGWRPREGFYGTGRATGGNAQQAAGRNHAEPWDTASPCAPVWKIKKISKGKAPLPKPCSLAAMTTISLH